MSSKATILLAFAAGLAGGALSRFVVPPPACAQAPASPAALAAQEISAHKFVLVDQTGAPRGIFGFQHDGTPEIQISQGHGHVFSPRWMPVFLKRDKLLP